MPKTPGLG